MTGARPGTGRGVAEAGRGAPGAAGADPEPSSSSASASEDAEAAIEVLNELSEIAKAVEAELARARRETDAAS